MAGFYAFTARWPNFYATPTLCALSASFTLEPVSMTSPGSQRRPSALRLRKYWRRSFSTICNANVHRTYYSCQRANTAEYTFSRGDLLSVSTTQYSSFRGAQLLQLEAPYVPNYPVPNSYPLLIRNSWPRQMPSSASDIHTSNSLTRSTAPAPGCSAVMALAMRHQLRDAGSGQLALRRPEP